jgi:Ca2+-binding RTX toxin-like protein
MNGGLGNDTVSGREGNDVIQGGAGDDKLYGEGGDDVLEGGEGNDVLVGGVGNDTYVLGRGTGADVIGEDDAAPGNIDVLLFEPGVSIEQLWLQRLGTALELSVIGANDRVLLENWYSGNQYHLEQFKTSEGKILLDTQVQNLVDAMAAFSPPALGQTSLSEDYRNALVPVLAASWQN